MVNKARGRIPGRIGPRWFKDAAGHYPDRLVRAISTGHATIYRLTRGRLGRRLVDNDMLLLTTTGSRTGRRHTVPLLYLRDGDDIIVFASFGGRDHHPQWYRNLIAHPEARVRVGERSLPVRATPATGAHRDLLWKRAVAAYGGYAAYQGKTERQIPVIVLSRR